MEHKQTSNHSAAKSKKAAALNAFALSFAAFFGFVSIFAAIAGFSGGHWAFSIPLIGAVLANVGYISVAFVTALLAFALAIIGALATKNITDKDALSGSWYAVSKVFFFLAIVYIVTIIAIALYSILGAGQSSGVNHEYLWLNNFLPNLVTAVGATVVCIFAKQISAGNTALLRAFSAIAITIASLGLILVVIQTSVGLYSSDPSSYRPVNSGQYHDIWGDFFR